MQRRHQKIIEEAPAIGLDEEALNKTFNACINLCKEMQYEGVGTIEFLYENNQFYFIEMNTRIQVEHPVTEMITDFDLVKAQLRIALGMEISLNQDEIYFHGHSLGMSNQRRRSRNFSTISRNNNKDAYSWWFWNKI